MHLFIIPTPIGNLQDITLRALETLKYVDAVFCEDTRRSLKLLNYLGIKKKLFRYNEHSMRSINAAVAYLRSGHSAALITDGGCPCISDPGMRLIAECREAGVKIIPLPGPCAAITAAMASGLPADSFIFLGFLPRARGKIVKTLSKALSLNKTIIIYESPLRVKKLIELIAEEFGGNMQVVIAREITKIHEEFISGSAGEIIKKLSSKGELKGEVIVLLSQKS